MATVWQTIGVWSAAAFLAVVAFTFLVRPMVAFADNAVRTMRRSPLSTLGGMLFLVVFVAFAGTKPGPGPGPTPPEPVATNRVTYVLGGGVNAPGNPATFTTNDLPVVLSAPTREGYDFAGWLPSDTIPVGTVTDVTYTATWAAEPPPPPEPVATNRVTYVLGGGVNAPGNPATFTTNDLPVVLSAPTREGYDFAGWLPSDTIPVGTVTDVTYTATWAAVPPPPPPERQPWPEASEWERIDIDAEYTTIESADKSRRNSAIPVETEGDVVVPDVLKLHRVVSIGTRAFYGCSRITSVDIPEGVTNIADYAFYNCSSLTNVVFPSTLKSIGAYAFVGCGQLKQVRIEVPRLLIGERAFRNCDGLKEVQFRGDELIANARAFFGCGGLLDVDFVTKDVRIDESAFSGRYDSSVDYGYCDHLTNVLIVASNRMEIGSSAFYYCTKLQNATVVSPKTAIFGNSVFSYCSGLKTIELPEGLVGLPTNALAYCSSLQSVSLSSNVTSIAYRAFDTCTSLTNVWMSEGLSVIESQAFYGCALRRLELPQSVSSVGSRAFEKCGDLKSVLVREGDTNRLEATSLAIGERAFYRCDALTTVRLPQRAAVLPARVFADCERLASINLPSNLTDIAESAFESCAALPYVDFPESLASIGAMAFNSCTALTGFSIPTNRIVDLGDKAFVGTKYWNEWPDNSLVENSGYILGFKGNPTSVELPEGCVAIPAEMFMGMTALTNVVVPASVKKVGLRAFAGSGVQTLALPDVTEIGVSAFEGCVNLATVVLADGLGEIPNLAFHGCTSLLAVDIPESVQSIGAEAFRECVALRDVTGGEGVRSVGDYAFAGCVNLLPFRFAQDVAYGEHVFQFVKWTENVLFPSVGTMAQEYPQTYADIRSIVMSASLTGIVDRACAGCASLEEVEIPSSVRTIGVSAFEGCKSLATVAFPAGLANVGSNAFKGCASVRRLVTSGQIVVKEVFGASVGGLSDISFAEGTDSICDYALSGCSAIAAITLPDELTEIGAYAFSGCSGLSADVIVPKGVTSIGDFAFENCTNLKFVKFMGGKPTDANSNIYAGTSKDLWTKVRLDNKESWAPDGVLPARWPVPAAEHETALANGDYANTRRIGWWTDAPKDEPEATIEFFYYNASGNHPKLSPEEGFSYIPDSRPDGDYEFLGWFTKPYGGVMVTEDNYLELGVTAVYAHWVRVGEDDPWAWDDVVYNANIAHVYDGYLLDGDAVVGTIQVKTAKGKYDKEDDETDVKVTATAMLLGEGKKLSFKGAAEGVDEDGGSANLVCTKKSDGREMSVRFTPNGLEGSFDGYEIVGARNMFGEKTDWDKRTARAAIDDWGGTYAVVLESEGDSPLANGIVVLTVKVATKGKCKVSGTMPDGTKVSVSSQLQILHADAEAGVTACELPVVVPLYSGKKGGFGFCIEFSPETEMGVEVVGLTEWLANPGKTDEFTATLMPLGAGVGTLGSLTSPAVFVADTGALEIPDVFVDDSLLPGLGSGVGVTPSGKKWILPKADKVKFDRTTETYEVMTDFGNPSGLKLTFTASSGTFKGSFKVYAVTEKGKSKTYTAQVNGAIVDGVGYGTAVIKKACSMPVVIQPEE